MNGLEQALELVRQGRPHSLGARDILSVEEHQRCGTRQVLAAARLSTFTAAGLDESSTMSTIAADRGLRFEQMVLSPKRKWPDVAEQISGMYGIDLAGAVPESFKNGDGAGGDEPGLVARADRLEQLVASFVTGAETRPRVIVHGVVRLDYGPAPAMLEPDILIVGPDRVRVGEIKSWMAVDRKLPPMQAAHASGQAALYLLGLEAMLERFGYRPDQWLDPTPFLVTPRNYTIAPLVTALDDAPRRAAMARGRLGSLTGRVEAAVTGLTVANRPRPNRPDDLIDQFGHHYAPAACAGCGLRDVCRARLDATDAVELLGFPLPGVPTVARAVELAAGATPDRAERSVASMLSRARLVLDAFGALPTPVEQLAFDTDTDTEAVNGR